MEALEQRTGALGSCAFLSFAADRVFAFAPPQFLLRDVSIDHRGNVSRSAAAIHTFPGPNGRRVNHADYLTQEAFSNQDFAKTGLGCLQGE